jgi:hypothetical protein
MKEDPMSENRTSTDIEAATREKALLGYEMAINLWIFQAEQGWARFNIMLFVNSIILGIIGLFITDSNPKSLWLLPLLAIVGLLLCVIWFLFMKRETEYAYYYIRSARELEEKYLSDTVKTVSRGRLLAEGHEVTIETSDEPTSQVRMSWLAQRLRARSAATVVVVVLVVLYIATISLHLAGVSPFAKKLP